VLNAIASKVCNVMSAAAVKIAFTGLPVKGGAP